MKRIFILLFICIVSVAFTQTDYLNHKKSFEILKAKLSSAEQLKLKDKPINEVFIEIAKSFIGTEYEGFVLEKPAEEKVFCYLGGLDCVSLVENSYVIARMIKKGESSPDEFLAELENLRYREGKNSGYTSRLHYYSDWLTENEKKGILKNISGELGGQKILTTNISFMSKNRKLYRQIKEDDKAFEEIKSIEDALNKREINYIGKEQIIGSKRLPKLNLGSLLRDGDLIALVSADNTMDISHSTIAIKQGDAFHILHAAKAGTKVQITKETIEEYLSNSPKIIGILVARFQEIN